MNQSISIDYENLVHEDESPDLVIAFVAAVGVNLPIAEAAFKASLERFGYEVAEIKITRDVIAQIYQESDPIDEPSFDRIGRMMDLGTSARSTLGDSILAEGVVSEIRKRRSGIVNAEQKPTAFLIHSLKHPSEVRCLRSIYRRNFYLVGIHTAPLKRESCPPPKHHSSFRCNDFANILHGITSMQLVT